MIYMGKEFFLTSGYMYNWCTLLYSKNEHNILNQLDSNKNFFEKDFPGGPVVKAIALLCKAGNSGLTPSQGITILHAAKQLGPHITA